MRIDDAADPGVKPPVLHGLSKFAEPFGARLVHDDASDEESPEVEKTITFLEKQIKEMEEELASLAQGEYKKQMDLLLSLIHI